MKKNQSFTVIFQLMLRLIFVCKLKVNSTNQAITRSHEVMVTKRKKLMRPQFATFMSAAIENANNNRICGEDDTEKLHYS